MGCRRHRGIHRCQDAGLAGRQGRGTGLRRRGVTAVRKFAVREGELSGSSLSPEAAAQADAGVSHNLNGQRLGRKGRVTRERILSATVELLESDDGEPISLSAVARRASLGMSSLYNYFGDLTELLLAVLEPVMATAEDAYLSKLRERWPEEELGERCLDFVSSYHRFWARHSRLLHLRNSMADQRDRRMMQHRVQSSQPIIALIVTQMDGANDVRPSPATSMATMLMTGIERSVTIATDRQLPEIMGWEASYDEFRFLEPGARLMEIAIRDVRDRTRS
ncbi:MAG: TetR/AcrR family transcriptional regulator [Novosphingobium sp.]|nr:TetR/AcrR family transcriptional regulator [Novosphingobium sp.]